MFLWCTTPLDRQVRGIYISTKKLFWKISGGNIVSQPLQRDTLLFIIIIITKGFFRKEAFENEQEEKK